MTESGGKKKPSFLKLGFLSQVESATRLQTISE